MNQKPFADHFSGHANDYAAARPTYPQELFAFLAEISSRNETAWDCATGSGQAAIALAEYFNRVIATDASEEQINHSARTKDNVEFYTAAAESSELPEKSVDLITVAQALHWFDIEKFYSEVRRVSVDGTVIAVWTYEKTQISPEIDKIVADFYSGEINDFWPPERHFVENQYRNIPFPFEPIPTPEFQMSVQWTPDELLAYFRTWSAVKRFENKNGRDPVDNIAPVVHQRWGSEPRIVEWPLTLKLGRVLIA